MHPPRRRPRAREGRSGIAPWCAKPWQFSPMADVSTLEHSVAAHSEGGEPKFQLREEEGGKCFVALAQTGGKPWVPTIAQPTVPRPRPTVAPKYRW